MQAELFPCQIMKKFVDDAFCEYLLTKKLLDKTTIAQVKADLNFATVRESLLLKKYVKFNTYQTILTAMRYNKELVDSPQSIEMDRKFIEYALRQEYISQEDAELGQKTSSNSAFTARELLMITSTIDLDVYTQIMTDLCRHHNRSQVDPDQTIIERNDPIKDVLTESQLSIVQDSSAETIIDMHMDGDLEENEEQTFNMTQDDDSIDTIIDGNIDLYPEDDSAISETVHMPQKNIKSHSYAVSTADYTTINTNSRDPRINRYDSTMATLSDTVIRPKPSSINLQDTQTYSIDDIVQEVQKQVNLQTQSISQSMGREMDFFKKFTKLLVNAMVILFVFFLTVAGLMEYQRAKEFFSLRKENQENKEELKKEHSKYLTENAQYKEDFKNANQKKEQAEAENKRLHAQLEDLKKQLEEAKNKAQKLAESPQEHNTQNQLSENQQNTEQLFQEWQKFYVLMHTKGRLTSTRQFGEALQKKAKEAKNITLLWLLAYAYEDFSKTSIVKQILKDIEKMTAGKTGEDNPATIKQSKFKPIKK